MYEFCVAELVQVDIAVSLRDYLFGKSGPFEVLSGAGGGTHVSISPFH